MHDEEREGALARLERRLGAWRPALRAVETGSVASLGDGIAWIDGLPSARLDELLSFDDGSVALAFHLARDQVGAILLRQAGTLAAGRRAYLTGQRLSIGVGDGLLGRVVDPLGYPLDGEAAPALSARREIDADSPSIARRDFLRRPLHTGNLLIDTLVPIGKGQRQLIIGDNGTGKSALAIDAVLNQRGKRVRCVYVLVGQKRSTVVATIEQLRSAGALEYSAVVAAEATALPGLKYLAPLAGSAVGEAWMEDGHDVLVVYDDLTTHARAYRELSLLLRRPPGREAYPGDVFHIHARLLERATQLGAAHGGGSLTALPIVETEQGEIASYIPTNLISITDGQVFLDQDLFARGQLPAIDVRRSVSRIGGKAQDRNVRIEAGRMKLDYLQALELEVFTRFGSKLEAGIEAAIARGRLLRLLLRQDRLDPQPIEYHLALLVAFNLGLLAGLQPDALASRLAALRRATSRSELELSAPIEAWRSAVPRWLAGEGGDGNGDAA